MRCRCCPASRSGRRRCCRPQHSMAESAPSGEVAAMVAVQSALAGRPGVLAPAGGVAPFGGDGCGWRVAELVGALLAPARRRQWLVAGVGTFVAHAAAVLIKRLVRRKRPRHPAGLNLSGWLADA